MNDNKKKSEIIKKTILEAIQYENQIPKSSSNLWSSLINNLYNAKNTITYNIVSRGTKFDYSLFNYATLFNYSYYLKNENDKKNSRKN